MKGHPLHAALYDPLMRVQDRLGLGRQRVRTARAATGRVLELGVGTGLDLPHYVNAAEVVGVGSAHARARASSRPLGAVPGRARRG